jgi:3-deoxy-D-manno-octulosonic-acid transferase
MLSSLYRYGNLAYIGGGFGVGIHNILEAATFGLPVIFGPNYKRFKEGVDLILEGGAVSISDFEELRLALNNLINNKSEREKASEICKKYIAKNVGSTKHIIKKVFNI